MAQFHRPRLSFDPLDLTHTMLERQLREFAEKEGEGQACQRELAHDKRRDAETLHDLKMPPIGKE